MPGRLLKFRASQPGMKVCTTCGKELPANSEYFYRCSANRDGLHGSCKVCQSEAKKLYLQTPRGKAKSRECEQRRHLDGRAALSLSKYHKTAKGLVARQRYYRSEACKEASRRYYHTEKGRRNARVKMQRRRAAGALPSNIYELLMDAQHGLCVYCEADLHETGYHLEHLTPVSMGGTNDILENLRLACPPCNESKGATHWSTFMLERGMVDAKTLKKVYGIEVPYEG